MAWTALYVLLLGWSATAAPQYAPSFAGPVWQNKSAADKESALNTQIGTDTTPYGWYSSVHLAELFIEAMNTSFDSVMDDMPAQNLFNLEERPKLIHSVGAIAECEFVSTGNHNYTGLFKGAKQAFIRFSLAKQPTTDPPNIVPGISMKFMRNGQPSGNLFAMYSLLGQKDFNFFAHDLTNHAPDFNVDASWVPFPQQLLYKAFSAASSMPVLLGLNRLARWDEDGTEYPNPSFPFRLIFHPAPGVHTLFPSAPQTGDDFFIKQFQQLKAGIAVYEVYAVPAPSADPTRIGYVTLKSAPSGSKFGDKDMFFQHTRMEEDLEMRPQWAAETKKILEHQRSTTTAYTYPDLPFDNELEMRIRNQLRRP